MGTHPALCGKSSRPSEYAEPAAGRVHSFGAWRCQSELWRVSLALAGVSAMLGVFCIALWRQGRRQEHLARCVAAYGYEDGHWQCCQAEEYWRVVETF